MILNRKARRALKPKGVTVAVRDSVAIQKDYVELCAKLGEVHIRADATRDILEGLNSDKNTLTQAIKKLQTEFEAHMKSEQENKLKEQSNAKPDLKAVSEEVTTAPSEASNTDASGTPTV